MLGSEFINYSFFPSEAFAELEKKLKIEKLGLVQTEDEHTRRKKKPVSWVWSHKT